LQTKLAELGYPNVQFRFIKAERPGGFVNTPVQPAAAPQTVAAPVAINVSPASAGNKTSPVNSVAAEKKPASVPFSKDDFKNDPLIQKALEIFKGQIVEVRA